MEMVMCCSCGNFVRAVPDASSVAPVRDECPDCGDTEFKHNCSGRRIVVD
ncbi:hypothetical protein [Halosimplex salinum]|nr:hypothetical protein [Halosimplex salinum]